MCSVWKGIRRYVYLERHDLSHASIDIGSTRPVEKDKDMQHAMFQVIRPGVR